MRKRVDKTTMHPVSKRENSTNEKNQLRQIRKKIPWYFMLNQLLQNNLIFRDKCILMKDAFWKLFKYFIIFVLVFCERSFENSQFVAIAFSLFLQIQQQTMKCVKDRVLRAYSLWQPVDFLWAERNGSLPVITKYYLQSQHLITCFLRSVNGCLTCW